MSPFALVESLPAHLYGITYYGDNIQDEWFIVSLLFHLSREIPKLIVRCCDSDGEFMLIEAAEHLPQWANPETCEQRVSILIESKLWDRFVVACVFVCKIKPKSSQEHHR